MEGHIIPSFKLASSLRDKGHKVTYLSVIDNEEMVRGQGFHFRPLFAGIYSQGFNKDSKQQIQSGTKDLQKLKGHLSSILDGELDRCIEEINPDLFIINVALRIEAILLYYKYKVRPVVLTTYLRESGLSFEEECVQVLVDVPADIAMDLIEYCMRSGLRFTSLREFLRPAGLFHELILCPRELDLDMEQSNDRTHYIGPSIFEKRKLGDIPDLSNLKDGVNVIYASMGSLTVAYGDASRQFFRKLINCMRHKDMAGFHLFLSVGQEFDISSLGPVPENISVMKWISQPEMLQASSLIITHGGLGTIKESIYYGVPMILFPMMYDQFRNARLIDHHLLGTSGKIQEISEEDLRTVILSVLNNRQIYENVKRMQSIFREKDAGGDGVRIIEEILENQRM